MIALPTVSEVLDRMDRHILRFADAEGVEQVELAAGSWSVLTRELGAGHNNVLLRGKDLHGQLIAVQSALGDRASLVFFAPEDADRAGHAAREAGLSNAESAPSCSPSWTRWRAQTPP